MIVSDQITLDRHTPPRPRAPLTLHQIPATVDMFHLNTHTPDSGEDVSDHITKAPQSIETVLSAISFVTATLIAALKADLNTASLM